MAEGIYGGGIDECNLLENVKNATGTRGKMYNVLSKIGLKFDITF